MIEVKGTKAQTRDNDPAQRYILKNADKKSKTPAIIGVFLMGLFVYLKSAITLSSQSQEDAPLPPEPDKKISPEQELAQVDMAFAQPHDSFPTATIEATEPMLGTGGMLMELMPPQHFIMIESPVLDFPPFQSGMPWVSYQVGLANGMGAANDNPNPLSGPLSGPTYGANTGPGEWGAIDFDRPDIDEPDDNAGGKQTEPDDGCNNTCKVECDDEKDEQENAKNRAPVSSGPVYLRDISGCAILAIGLAELLQNVFDPDGDVLIIKNLTVSSGTLTPTTDGWVFQSGSQLTGPVTISYQVSDGEFFTTQTAHFSVTKSLIKGSDCDDNLIGTKCADDIDGGSGDDKIEGLAGDDTINGGHGNDYILGGTGNDTLFGAFGNDTIYGGSGNDHISGGEGDDFLYGETGDDVIFGDAGNDYISGGDGKDVLFGGEGNDLINGDAGDDTIDGGAGNDLITGGAGDDTIYDGTGSDSVYAQAGNDHVVAARDGDDDIYDGGAGCDTLDYSATTAGVKIDLTAGTASGPEIGCDTISNFETLIGGQGDDHFIASDGPTVMIGGEGQNSFEFTAPPEPTNNIIMHEIIDFKLGDRIRLSKYDLFERALDKLEDCFEDIYGKDFDDDDVPLRYRHDLTENRKQTIIEADLDRDDFFETSITLDGHRMFVVIVEHA